MAAGGVLHGTAQERAERSVWARTVDGCYKMAAMPVCKMCGEEVETLVAVKTGGKTKKLCEDCAERVRQEEEIAETSESVVQEMMGFKGRR